MILFCGTGPRIEKAHKTLVDRRLPDHFCSGQAADANYECAGMSARAFNQLGNARSAQLPQRGVCWHGPTTSRPFRVPVDLVASVAHEHRIARAVRESGAMRLWISYKGVTAVEWRVEPFVTVIGP